MEVEADGGEQRVDAVAADALEVVSAHSVLGFHVAGALRNSLLTPDEVRGIALHLNPYVGYPTARDAMVVIDREIAEWEKTAEQIRAQGDERG